MSVKIFISYAHEDEPLMHKLQQHFGGLRHQEIIQSFDDRQITAGTEWDDRIKHELETADIVLLLISPGFLGSSYINKIEVKQAIERHDAGDAIVIPVALRPCAWAGMPFQHLQGLPRDLKPVDQWPDENVAFQEITEAVYEKIAGLKSEPSETVEESNATTEAQQTADNNPYRGLLAFREEDADRFFGRSALTDEVYATYQGLHHGSATRLFAIIGPSGSGKSSFARAGLAAQLKAGPLPSYSDAVVLTFMPGANPLYQLGLAIARHAFDDQAPVQKAMEFAEVIKKAYEAGDHHGLSLVVDALPEGTPGHLHLLIDQFEEVYSLCEDPIERDAFVHTLLNAASKDKGKISVILTLRSDFLGATQQHSQLNSLITDQSKIVPAMGLAELREAITEPAARANHPIDDATVNLLIDQTEGREGALPLLQFVLSRIWDGMVAGVEPAATVEKLGGVGGALAAEAQSLYDELQPNDKVIARRAFRAMVRLGEGTRDTRRRALLTEIIAQDDPDKVRETLDVFAQPDKRLISLAADSGPATAEVSHEALLDHWRQLKDWLSDNRDELRFHRRLADVANQWDQSNRPKGSLWRRPDLDLLEEFHGHASSDMTTVETAFFEASRQAEFEDKQKLEDQQRFQIEHEQYKAGAAHTLARRTRFAAIGLGCLALVGMIVGYTAYQERKEADSQRIAAKKSEAIAIAAEKLAQERATEAADAAKLADSAARRAIENESRALTVLASIKMKDGRYLDAVNFALASWPRSNKDNRPKLIAALDVLGEAQRNLRQAFPPMRHEGPVNAAVFNKNGTKVLTSSKDGTARLFDAANGLELIPPMRHQGAVENAVFSKDETKILTSSKDGTVRLFDATNGLELIEPMRHEGPVNAAVFNKNGTKVLTSSKDGTARLFDAANGLELIPPMRHQGPVLTAVFGEGETKILTGSEDGTARLFDTTDGEELIPPIRHRGSVLSVALGKDGTKVLTSSSDDTARLFDATDGRELIPPMQHEGPVWSAVFSRDETKILTSSFDRTARLFDAIDGRELIPPLQHEGPVWSAVFSRDETKILTSSFDGSVRLFNTAHGGELIHTMHHKGTVWSAEFSRDETKILTSSSDGTARLFDATTGQELIPPMQHDGTVNHAVFSRDATKVLTSSEDGKARLFDTTNGHKLIHKMRHRGPVYGAAFSEDETKILARSEDGTARLFDATTGQELTPPLRHEGTVWSAVLSTDGTKALTGSSDGTARLFDATTGQELIPPMHHQGRVIDALFSKDEMRILTSSSDSTARLFDATNGQELIPPLHHKGPVWSAVFSKDETKILTRSSDGTARLYDGATGQELVPPMRHEGTVSSAVFSKDETKILTSSVDDTARLFDATTGQELVPPMRHEGTVSSAVFSKDETKILTSSSDKTARLFDATNGQELIPPMRHGNWVRNAIFNKDETKILTYSGNTVLGSRGIVRLFDVISGQELIPAMHHDGPVWSAAFNKDETKILTSSEDGAARLWEVSKILEGDLFDLACQFYLLKGGLDLSNEASIGGYRGLRISIYDPICASPPPKPDWVNFQ